MFNEARELFNEVHRLAPGMPTMTTAQDASFGKETGCATPWTSGFR